MFDSTVLNVVIGLVLIFLLYSLLATAMQEAIASMLQRRANMLQYGIKCMLTKTINNNNKSKIELIIYHSEKKLTAWYHELMSFFKKREMKAIYERFYNHPIIKNYGQNSLFSKPSYIGARNFSTILIDSIKNLDANNISKPADFKLIEKVLSDFNEDDPEDNHALIYRPIIKSADGTEAKAAVNINTPRMDKETHQILTFHLKEAGGDLDVLRSRMEQWFNDTMDRVTGWYKKNTHYWLFGIGLFLAFTLNIDTIEISNYLSKNKAAAEQLAKMGEAAIASDNPAYKGQDSIIAKIALDTIKKNIQQVNTLIGLGWNDYGRSDTSFINSLKDEIWLAPGGSWYRLPSLFGLWYPMWFPFKTVSLKDTFELNTRYVDSIGAMYKKQTDSLSTAINSDRESLQAKKQKQKSDTIKLWQDSLALNSIISEKNKNLDSLRFLVGYDKIDRAYAAHLKAAYICSQTGWEKFFGFFITAMAIGLGAPFWYDLLNKFVNVKSAGKATDSQSGQGNSSDNKDKTEG
jgi:hypothetical protein